MVSTIFKNSIIVSAHPDDEILWFSSILDKVDRIIICFLGCKKHLEWKSNRKKVIDNYPLQNLSCLEIEESCSYKWSNWIEPISNEFGMEVMTEKNNYNNNYYKIKEILEQKIKHYANVFTHNPWGEYGHAEHVQIYKIMWSLQKKYSFNLWFTNYCSNKSYKLYMDHISINSMNYVKFPVNKTLTNTIKNLYIKNNCWTWEDDWSWFENDYFFTNSTNYKKRFNKYPINFITIYKK